MVIIVCTSFSFSGASCVGISGHFSYATNLNKTMNVLACSPLLPSLDAHNILAMSSSLAKKFFPTWSYDSAANLSSLSPSSKRLCASALPINRRQTSVREISCSSFSLSLRSDPMQHCICRFSPSDKRFHSWPARTAQKHDCIAN